MVKISKDIMIYLKREDDKPLLVSIFLGKISRKNPRMINHYI